MRFLAALTVSALAACQPPSGTGGELTPEVRQVVEREVEAAHRALLTVAASADIDAILGSFERDGLYVDAGVAHASYDAYTQFYRPGWSIGRMEITNISVRVAALDASNAVAYAHYGLKQFDADDEVVNDLNVPLFTVWTRRSGEWVPHSYHQDSYSQVDGVWAYFEPYSGIVSYRQGRFIHLAGSSDAPGAVSFGLGGTYKVVGDTVFNSIEYHSSPSEIGQTFKWTYEGTGDTLRWSVVNDQGEVVQSGRNRRLAR